MNIIQWILIVLVFVAIAALGGVLIIWALNTLFPTLAIKYGIYEVLAAIILSGTVSGVVSRE